MKNIKYDLRNKYCLITGAAGLLGEEHAHSLLEINANVILTDIDIKKLNFIKKRLIKKYPASKIFITKMDVSKERSIKKIVKNLKKKKVKLYCLINNAAIDAKVKKNQKMSNSSSFEKILLQDWERHLSVGLTGAMLCSKYFGRMIVSNKNGGVIVNVASDLSVIAPNHRIYSKGVFKPVMYSVVKHGIIGLTKYLATYWADKNIRTNCLCPGGVYESQDKAFVKRISNLIPLKRMARVDEYKGAIQFLCSDASSYMNGSNLIIDGGRTIW